MKRKNRKGAFQLSLSFIIGLIFAVILLTLAVMWVRDTFSGVSVLTDDLRQNAQNTLASTFDNEKTNFDVSPKRYDLDVGKSVILSAGVKNDKSDGKPHKFVIRMYPGTADQEIIENYGCTDFDTCNELKTDMNRWLTYIQKVYNIESNAKRFWDITITLPQDVKRGTYMYDLAACEGDSVTFSGCDRSTANWGSTKTLTVKAK